MTTAAEHVSALINGFWAAQVANAAAALKAPDHLAGRPLSAPELAAAAGADGSSMLRLLRAMQTLGLVVRQDDGRFALTEAGQLLRSDVEGSVRGRALFTGDMLWKQFGDLAEQVRTGGRTKAVVSGAEGFAALVQDPPRLHAFQQAMAESSLRAAREALTAYDFGRFATVLDLGGGYGGVLSELLKAHPRQTGAVCDLGYLEEGALGFLAGAGVEARSRFIAGDFFEAVPSGFKLYLMKFIVHDWGDGDAARILRNVRTAAGQATLALLEQVVPDRLTHSAADQAVIRGDLTMMGMGGKERTAEEYRELLQGAGWRLSGIIPAGSSFSVIEALPA
jgi:hypothetical protein